MYSNKDSVNILTALLVAHGIRHAVVCPGSRNAPIVHNFNECPDIECHPVTDERSAAFFALGIAQATDQPVAVCVTSGTALLNVAPAVAEAHYQHQALVVISADRPAQWIGQLDGQTLQQPGALQPWVEKSVDLPEDNPYYANRLVNEALIEATADHHPCVHINVPLSEPLFQFDVQELPQQRVIRRYTPTADYACLPQVLLDDFLQAQRPLIVFGQLSPHRFHYEGVDHLFSHVIVLHEALAPFTSVSHFEHFLGTDAQPPHPDFILHVGDAIVSKRLKAYLRQAPQARTWRINVTGQVEDTFLNLRGIVKGDAERLLQSLDNKLAAYRTTHHDESWARYRRQWLSALSKHSVAAPDASSTPSGKPFSEASVVAAFEQALASYALPYHVHYANSTPIRLANDYAHGHPVWCNRGVNGIDGSLSTAAGFAAALSKDSTASKETVFCVIGDLSFFYDQNALWNQQLTGNLRILLLNNGGGAIFQQLKGLEQSPACPRLVAATHHATAEGICHQNDIYYQLVTQSADLPSALDLLLHADLSRPMVLEALFQP